MKLVILFLMPLIAWPVILMAADGNIGVEVFFDNLQQLEQVNSRMSPINEQIGLVGFYKAAADDLDYLNKLGLRYSTFQPRAPIIPVQAELDSFFYTCDEMIDSMQSWVAQYPAIAHYESIGVSQQEQRIIYAFKVSDNVEVDEDEPVLLFDGAHHACEIMGMEICLGLIDTLLTHYGIQPEISAIVDSNEIWFVPLINPDGNSAVHDGISLNYRKNGRDTDNDGQLYEYGCNDSWTCPTEGVDVNRNYDWYWSFSGSGTPLNYYYRGPSAGSETENYAITGLVARIRPVLSVTYHSWGEVYFYTWVWPDNSVAPDHELIYSIASEAASRISKENGYQTYDPTPSDGKGGLALNWQYGRYGVISFLPETVQYPDFIPESLERKNAVIDANLQGNFYLISRAHGSQITGLVTDRRTGAPLEAEIRVLEYYSTLVDPRKSEPAYGRYRRLLLPGTYTLEIHHPDYPVKTIPDVIVRDGEPAIVNIQLGSIIPGDANDSGVLNGVDVIYVVNYLKGIGPAPDPLILGDANGDCQVNGMDVIYLVNYFKGGSEPVECPGL